MLPGLPLIESGTGGFAGQVRVIKAGETECFECDPKSSASVSGARKTYAVCTIRNTPDKPEHCVVWAKYVFEALFGPDDSGSHNVMSDLKLSAFNRKDPFQSAKSLFQKLFETDIEEARSISDRWKHRDPPRIIYFVENFKLETLKQGIGSQAVGSISEMVSLFISSFQKIASERKEYFGSLKFDKDDNLILDFVVALSNLRSSAFGIPRKSKFDVKGIAGNIIHAIATTNAIAGGLMALQMRRVLQSSIQDCKLTWIGRSRPRVLNSESLNPPNPNCHICSSSQLCLLLDTTSYSLKKFYEDVLKAELGLIEPSIDIPDLGQQGYIGEIEDHDDPETLNATLSSFNIRNGTILVVAEMSSDLDGIEFNIQVEQKTFDSSEDPQEFEIRGFSKRAGSEKRKIESLNDTLSHPETDRDEVELYDLTESEPKTKKLKTESDVICLD